MKNLFANLMLFFLFPLFVYSAAAVPLGSAATFGVLAGSTVTNTGASIITGNLGVSPGTAVTGFPPGTVTGTIYSAGAVAGQAQVDLTTAYNNAAGQASTANLTGQNLGGLTLTPGVYTFSSSAQLTGTLTLNGNGVYIFQIGSTLTTASSSAVVLAGGALASNVFWQVGSSATLGTGTSFNGTILALASITATTGATINGAFLARNGAVTLDTNTVTVAAAPIDAPVLGLLKTHSPATFTVGENGTYTITVSNLGFAPTDGTIITVLDTLPTGLTFISGSGSGWTVNAVGQTVTATTTAIIAAGASAPPITLTVAVGSSAASMVTNTVTASGGGSATTASVTDVATFLLPPTNFTATKKKCINLSQTDLVNHLSWTPSISPGVVEYLLYRNGTLIAIIPGSGPYYYNDHNRHKNQIDVYTLIAADAAGHLSTSVTVTVN